MGRVRAFDDVWSVLHSLFAAALTLLSPEALIAASIVYYAYQRYERERWERKRGDFVEWMVGILLGAVMRACLTW